MLELPAHTVVLVTQSGYFNTVFKEGFAESITKEFRYTKAGMHAHCGAIFRRIHLGN